MENIMTELKLLNNEQEKQILDCLASGYMPIGHGASRFVFPIDTKQLIDAGLELDINKRYVVKVAIGIAGINQNNVESTVFRYNGSEYLAEIPYIGHYVEIMEYVEPLPDSVRNWADEYYFEDFYENVEDDLTKSEASRCFDVIQELNNINGCTSDNGQLGYNDNGDIVAYDYGYLSGSDEVQCSDLLECIDPDSAEQISAYLLAIKNIIAADEDAMAILEEQYMDKIRENIENGVEILKDLEDEGYEEDDDDADDASDEDNSQDDDDDDEYDDEYDDDDDEYDDDDDDDEYDEDGHRIGYISDLSMQREGIVIYKKVKFLDKA